MTELAGRVLLLRSWPTRLNRRPYSKIHSVGDSLPTAGWWIRA
jgi:hypothetical protein